MEDQPHLATVKGKSVTLVGNDVRVGRRAPDFIVVDENGSAFVFSTLVDAPCLISSVLLLDDREGLEHLWQLYEGILRENDDLRILTISMDLPNVLRRWHDEQLPDRVSLLSDHRDASFGVAYGVLIKELRLLARAVFVVDSAGVVRHKEIVSEATGEADPAALLEAVRRIE